MAENNELHGSCVFFPLLFGLFWQILHVGVEHRRIQKITDCHHTKKSIHGWVDTFNLHDRLPVWNFDFRGFLGFLHGNDQNWESLQSHPLLKGVDRSEFLTVFLRVSKTFPVCMGGIEEICQFYAFMVTCTDYVLINGVFSVRRL